MTELLIRDEKFLMMVPYLQGIWINNRLAVVFSDNQYGYTWSDYMFINRFDNPYSSVKFGDFGMNNRVDASADPIYSYEFDLIFSQTEEEAAQFEKLYSIQRATPFMWPSLNCLDLWEGQGIENVMVKGFKSTHLTLNNWRIELKLITNV